MTLGGVVYLARAIDKMRADLQGTAGEYIAACPQSKLVWRFLQTLDFNFALPEKIEPNRHMSLFARWGEARVTDEALHLVVSWGLDAQQNATSGAVVPPDAVLGDMPGAPDADSADDTEIRARRDSTEISSQSRFRM